MKSRQPPHPQSAALQPRRCSCFLALLAASLLLLSTPLAGQVTGKTEGISKAAAESCRSKVEKLEAFAQKPDAGRRQSIRFSEQEINSYLALDLSTNYSPSLKSLEFTFTENALQADAVIDFDRLGLSASKLLARLMSSMLSGIHRLSARGKLIAQAGKANFDLQEAKFDGTTLPNFFVEEIITAVGRRQKPPVDPIEPSPMPYRIDRVVCRPGYIIVYQ
jgi:hypothetical protein